MAAQGLTSFAMYLLQIGLNRHQHADLNTRIGQHEPQVVSAASTPLSTFATRNRLPFTEGCVACGQDLQAHMWAPSGANMS